jgi:hypothetical protein
MMGLGLLAASVLGCSSGTGDHTSGTGGSSGGGGSSASGGIGGGAGSSGSSGSSGSNGSTGCDWAYLVEFSNPVVVTNTNDACSLNDCDKKLDAAGIAAINGTRTGIGFSKVTGHGDAVMQYDDATKTWAPIGRGNWDPASGSIMFRAIVSQCNYGSTGGAISNPGTFGESGDATATTSAFMGTIDFFIEGTAGADLGSSVCDVKFDVNRVGDAPAGCGQ